MGAEYESLERKKREKLIGEVFEESAWEIGKGHFPE